MKTRTFPALLVILVSLCIPVRALAEDALIPHTVRYDANGASGDVPSPDKYAPLVLVTVQGRGNLVSMQPDGGHNFVFWNTQSDGSGTSFAEGQVFTMGNKDITLFAIWMPLVYEELIYLWGIGR